MFRIALAVLALMVGIDHFIYNGKFAAAGLRASTSMLRHFGLV